MKKILSCLFLASVIGCTSLSPMPNQAPKTYNQLIVEKVSIINEMRESTGILLVNGAITVKDAQKIEDTLQAARSGLDLLMAQHNANPNAFVNFDAITAILVSARDELNNMGAKK